MSDDSSEEFSDTQGGSRERKDKAEDKDKTEDKLRSLSPRETERHDGKRSKPESSESEGPDPKKSRRDMSTKDSDDTDKPEDKDNNKTEEKDKAEVKDKTEDKDKAEGKTEDKENNKTEDKAEARKRKNETTSDLTSNPFAEFAKMKGADSAESFLTSKLSIASSSEQTSRDDNYNEDFLSDKSEHVIFTEPTIPEDEKSFTIHKTPKCQLLKFDKTASKYVSLGEGALQILKKSSLSQDNATTDTAVVDTPTASNTFLVFRQIGTSKIIFNSLLSTIVSPETISQSKALRFSAINTVGLDDSSLKRNPSKGLGVFCIKFSSLDPVTALFTYILELKENK